MHSIEAEAHIQAASQDTPLVPNASDGIGRVIAVSGGQCTVALDLGCMQHRQARAQMGALLAIQTAGSTALAVVSSLSVPKPATAETAGEVWIAELGLVGEIRPGRVDRSDTFARGVSIYPGLGDRVRLATHAELECAFAGRSANNIRVGHVLQDSSIPALVDVDDMLGKHFAVVGTTGTGKSCTTALLLRQVLEKNPQAHIVLLDPHNEYATAFRDSAEVISQGNMQLPYWLLTFEELIEVVMGGRRDRRQEIEVLQELIPIAKARYGRGASQQGLRRPSGEAKMTVDTPLPYRLSELIALIDERMGRLDNKRDLTPYRNLRARIDALMQDPRYAFMFGSLTVYDSMAQILGRLFRVPTNGRPITIFELTGVPTESTAPADILISRTRPSMGLSISVFRVNCPAAASICLRASFSANSDVWLSRSRWVSRSIFCERSFRISFCVSSFRCCASVSSRRRSSRARRVVSPFDMRSSRFLTSTARKSIRCEVALITCSKAASSLAKFCDFDTSSRLVFSIRSAC